MTRDETLALYAQGKAAWNAWAESMLAERAAMEKAGTWAAGRDVIGDLEPRNDATQAWMARARADFTGHTFKGGADFNGFVFPGEADFRPAKAADGTEQPVTFKGGARFNGVTFQESARFDGATFSGEAGFREVTFSADALFAGAKFLDQANFQKSQFAKLAGFAKNTFEGDARFDDAVFSGMAGFGGVTFKGGAAFDRARFLGPAGFAQSVYEGFASFEDARFEKATSFAAIHGKERSTFSMRGATFLNVPDFEQAHFAEAPRLDVSAIRQRLGAADTLQPVRQSEIGGDPAAPQDHALVKTTDTTARWRALKRLAVQGHDHEREQIFFAEEVKSLRGSTDLALPWFRTGDDGAWRLSWPGGARYWVGWLYQAFSDFGRSMVRPLMWWAAITGAFALIYLSQHFTHHTPRYQTGLLDRLALVAVGARPADPLACLAGTASDPAASALYLAVHKGSIVAGLGGSDKLAQAYACLYGIDQSFGDLSKQQLIPVIPDDVVFWSLFQTILSAALIFLFLLAVRNQFRIK